MMHFFYFQINQLNKASCFKASQKQELLQKSGIDFFSLSEFPGNSSDLMFVKTLAVC